MSGKLEKGKTGNSSTLVSRINTTKASLQSLSLCIDLQPDERENRRQYGQETEREKKHG